MFNTWLGSPAEGGPTKPHLQTAGMLSKEQLLILFEENARLLDMPENKQRIRAGVKAGKEASEVTTEMQEELLQSMGVDPQFGIQCLGRVSTVYQNDRELLTKFFTFVAKEELACDEAELPADIFRKKQEDMEHMRNQQAQMLESMRHKTPEEQREALRQMQQHLQQAQAQRPGQAMSPQEVFEFLRQQHGQQGR